MMGECAGSRQDQASKSANRTCLAVEEAYRHRADLQRLLMARLKSEEQVKEIVQETFARFLTISDADKIGNPRGYLFRMAINLSIDQARCARSNMFRNAMELNEETSISDAPTPEENLEYTQLKQLLDSALSELPPRSRELFYLHRFEGLSTMEIARQFGISQRMVQKALARVTEHFSHRLESAWAV